MARALINRRTFGLSSVASLAAFSASRAFADDAALIAAVGRATIRFNGWIVPPIYITAYIEPDTGQEEMVARYPMAIVPQSNAPNYMRWRDKVRQLNPHIVLLGYQMTSLESNSSGRGPGHNMMTSITNAWVTLPGGIQPTVETPPRRLYDMRRDEWKNVFLDACSATLKSYPYDGLFLDQCSVFNAHSPFPSVRAEMRQHLQEVLLELRRRHPTVLLVGNSTYKWQGLNGEMSEDRPNLLSDDLKQFAGHAKPNLNMSLIFLRAGGDSAAHIRKTLIQTCALGAFYSAIYSTKTASWFPIFDEVISVAKRRQANR